MSKHFITVMTVGILIYFNKKIMLTAAFRPKLLSATADIGIYSSC